MKKFIALFSFIFFFLMVSVPTFAQEVIVPTQDFIMALLQSIGGIKGASTLTIVGIVLQVLFQFMHTPLFGSVFKKVDGAKKLLIILFLTLVSGVVSLMQTSDLSLSAALIHSSTLAAFSVFANQLYKQFVEKKS